MSKYAICLAFGRFASRLSVHGVGIAVAANASVGLAAATASLLFINESLGYLMTREIEKMQQQAAGQILAQLQEDMILNPDSKEQWN